MPAQWTGDVVGKMHTAKISHKTLAEQLGVTREYVTNILNGHRAPKGAEDRFRTALDEILSRKKSESEGAEQ